MQYRLYGKTGKNVSVIGLGGMRFGPDEEEGVRAVHRAVELGINYIDTAPGYCKDRSESIIGEAVKNLKSKVYLSTKSSVYDQPTAADVRKRIDEARKRLNSDRITFFHMWCIMDWDHFEKVMAKDGPYQGAVEAKKDGDIEHIVFSTHANGAEIRKMCESGVFEGITLGYHLFNYTNRYDGILAASENEMGVAVMNPLGGGMVPAGAEKLRFLLKDDRETVVQAALRFVISHPQVTVALAGMGTIAHVEENATAGETTEAPDDAIVQAIKDRYSALGESFCTACRYCLPCPEQIEIPAILSALNRHRVGMIDSAKAFYKFFKEDAKEKWVEAKSCSECGLCEERCTQRLPVRSLLKQASELFETGSS